MRKLIIIVCVILGVILFLIGGFFAVLSMGSVMPVERVTIYEVKVENASVNISGDFLQDSALAYKGFKFKIADNILYVKIYKVLVSNIDRYGDVAICIEDDFSSLQKIYLDDGTNQKLIWER